MKTETQFQTEQQLLRSHHFIHRSSSYSSYSNRNRSCSNKLYHVPKLYSDRHRSILFLCLWQTQIVMLSATKKVNKENTKLIHRYLFIKVNSLSHCLGSLTPNWGTFDCWNTYNSEQETFWIHGLSYIVIEFYKMFLYSMKTSLIISLLCKA